MWSKNRVPLKYDIFKGPHCGEGLFFLPRSPHISDFVDVNKFEATRMMTGFFNKKTHPGALWSLNPEAWMGTGTFIISRCARGDLEIINADRVYFARIGFDFYKEHAANHCAKSILCVNRTTNGNAIIITNNLLYIEFSRGR